MLELRFSFEEKKGSSPGKIFFKSQIVIWRKKIRLFFPVKIIGYVLKSEQTFWFDGKKSSLKIQLFLVKMLVL